MMVDFLIRNLPVYLVFLTMAAFAWIFGGSQAAPLKPVMPWLLALLFEGFLFFPQRRPYEDAVAARRRCWWHVRRDPVFYLALVFLFVLLVPLVNSGLCVFCDRAAIQAGADAAPPLAFLPFCVNVSEHYGVIQWFVPALTAMLAVRHALSRHGKRMLLEMLVWNSAALAVFGFIQQLTGATSPFWGDETFSTFFSTFGYPNMGGSFFTMTFAFSVGLWQYRVVAVADRPPPDATSGRDRALVRWISAHYPLVAVVLNFFAALATLSRAAILMVSILAFVAFVYYEVWLLFSRHDRVRRVKRAAFAFGGALAFLLAVYVFAPSNLGTEVHSLDSLAVLDRVSGKSQYHTRVAFEIFKAHPAFGVGGWGYRHFARSYMTEDELKQIQIDGGANVHNDYLQFLCEHGAVGFICLAAIFICLLVPLARTWFKLNRAASFMTADKAPPKPCVIYCFPAGAFWILLGDTALIVHAFGDCPMRSAAVLSTFFVSLACAEGFLPREIEEGKKK